MIVLFWDIDGTLITTGKAGVPAWEQAVRDTTGREFQLSSIRIAGMTDYQIAVRTFEILGVDADEAMLRRLVGRYEDLLPHTLPTRQGRVLPQVREILDALRARADVQSWLLTGNTRRGAQAKLSHYGLWHYFADGAFAEDTRARATIAERALELARTCGPLEEEAIFVIGDTPHDVECANAINVRTIAVATGGYSLEELAPHGPWRMFAELPPPAQFVALVEQAAGAPQRSPDAGVVR
jgi:phosphoglycolate phosphatase-like HAD superfamily hydrolase